MRVNRPQTEVDTALRSLEASHSVVLHPGTLDVWVAHPFSTSPTATWIQKGERGWWAPCLWCGFGVATLVGGDVILHSRIGGESEPVRIAATDGHPKTDGLVVHFPQPPRDAWANVHHFCSRLLPFRSVADIDAWTRRHALPMGQVLSLSQLADLARRWYGKHADPDWRKFTMSEAAAVFAASGLEGEFWQLEVREGAF